MRIVFLTCFVFLITSISAHAADINDAGAAKLKTLFETIIDEQTRLAGIDAGFEIQKQGNVIVEQEKSYYAVTLPHIRVKYADNTMFEFGIISINVAPHKDEGQWKMTLALPTPMGLYDSNGDALFHLSVAGQKAAGIFHEDVRQFSKLDMQLNNITVKDFKNPNVVFTIGDVIMRVDTDEDSNGRWSGPGYAQLKNLHVSDRQDTQAIKIGGLTASFAMDQYDPAAGTRYQERILVLQENEGLNLEKMSEADMKEIGDALLDLFTTGMNGFDGSYVLNNLHVTMPDKIKEGNDPVTIKVEEGAFSMDMGGFLDGKIEIGLGVNYSGFHASNIDAKKADFLPSTSKIDFRLKNVPFRELLQIGQNTLTNANGSAEQAMQMGMLSMAIKVPAILSQAGTVLEFKDNHIGNDLFHIDLNGDVRADLTAANSAVANAQMRFKGLDALLSRVQDIMADDPNAKDIIQTQGIKNNLSWLKNLGRIENDLYIFDLIMDAQGQVLLNGQDVRTLSPPSGQ